jgi:hypothetical protein
METRHPDHGVGVTANLDIIERREPDLEKARLATNYFRLATNYFI